MQSTFVRALVSLDQDCCELTGFYCNMCPYCLRVTKLSERITQFNRRQRQKVLKRPRYALFFSLFCLLLATTSAASGANRPSLSDLKDVVPTAEGEVISIVGGRAAAHVDSNKRYQSDMLVVVRVEVDGQNDWIWLREGEIGIDFNSSTKPIEFDWHRFEENEDLTPVLNALRENWGDKLFWRPPPVNSKMSFMNWRHMDTFVMKSPRKDVTITNVVQSDNLHKPSIGSTTGTVSHHRMWYFPAPPRILRIGELNSAHHVTFRDESFDQLSPWRWTHGARWRVQAGACKNPYYLSDSEDPSHESYYEYIRWFSGSGLISIDVPEPLRPQDRPQEVQIHSNFEHTWGDGLFIQSTPLLELENDILRKNWSQKKAGSELLNINLSGSFFDSGITIRASGQSNPINELKLHAVTIADPFSQGTAFSGDGKPAAQLDGGCSSPWQTLGLISACSRKPLEA